MRVFIMQTILYSALLAVATSAATYAPIQPPSYPIAVKNPYFSAWFPGNQVDNIGTSRAEFWAGAKLTWSVLARVDGKTYNLFGVEFPESNTGNCTAVSAEYTASHTKFTVDAGGARFLLDFLSPVNPKDYLRQSLPFSYLTVSVVGVLNGESSSIQVYSDIDDSWNGQNLRSWDQTSDWKLTNKSTTSIWQISHVNAKRYDQGGPNGDMALWGSVIYATKPYGSSNLTTAAGQNSAVRSTFVTKGELSSLPTSPTWAKEGVTAFAHDLGIVNSSTNVTFALGYTRDCDLEYMGNCRVGYYRSSYSDAESAAAFFLDDYVTAQQQSLDMDSKIESQALSAAGQNYVDIVTLSTRQTFGGLDLTIPGDTMDVNNFMVFLKEISSDGNVNTMDVIYPAFPLLYVMDVEYIRLLLEPVLQYLASGNWKQPYVVHDIGSNYPLANGHNDQKAEAQPIEETGNLLILAWAYIKTSGNTAWAAKYLSLFQGYADYLIAKGLYIEEQLSTDDAVGAAANQTNLAVKAAVGLTSFGALSNQTRYALIGKTHALILYDLGLGLDSSRTHLTYQYGKDNTWSMIFNLFPDYLLKLETFNPSIFALQSSWYPQVRSLSGVALDSELNWTKTDWSLWVGAISSNDTMKMIVNDLHDYLSNGLNQVPFSDKFDVQGKNIGKFEGFKARPVVGGHWSAMALQGRF